MAEQHCTWQPRKGTQTAWSFVEILRGAPQCHRPMGSDTFGRGRSFRTFRRHRGVSALE
nr:unnamed protein product [Callosobruchus analis]